MFLWARKNQPPAWNFVVVQAQFNEDVAALFREDVRDGDGGNGLPLPLHLERRVHLLAKNI